MSASHICSMLVALALLLTVVPAQTPPPSSGDWVISDSTTISGQIITLDGNLYIKGNSKLELSNSKLIMNCQNDGQYMIKVEPNGELVMNNTTVTCTNTSLHYKFIIVGKAIIDNSTIEEVWGSANLADAGIFINSNETSFSGTKVRSCPQTGMTILNCYPTIRYCTFYDNKFRGILCDGSASPEICKNTIHDNGKNGINLRGTSSAKIIDNVIYNHSITGINIYEDASPAILRNTIYDIMWENMTAGISDWGSSLSRPKVENNTIWNCKAGISNDGYSNATITENQISQCTIYGIAVAGNATPTIFKNNIFSDCKNGIYNADDSSANINENMITDCYAYGIWTIGGAKPRIYDNDLINCDLAGMVNEGSTVVTSDGNYIYGSWYGIHNSGATTVRIHDNTMTTNSICGVWIAGDSEISLNHSLIEKSQFGIYNDHFLNVSINDNNITLNKFGIWNNGSGILAIANNSISKNIQAGIYNTNDSKPTILDNNITHNEYSGINNTGRSNSIIIRNSISNNTFVGITNHDSSVSTIEYNNITGHYSDGIFICDTAVSKIIGNPDISGNQRGISSEYHAVARIERNYIHDNKEDGIAGSDKSVLAISNNTISQNGRYGIHGEENCNLTIYNNTLEHNSINILMKDCRGMISQTTIKGGTCGIGLYGTGNEISISEVNIDMPSEKGIYLSDASPTIQGTVMNRANATVFGCECIAHSNPRITGLTLNNVILKWYRVIGDSHPQLVDQEIYLDRFEVWDNSSIIINKTIRLQVNDNSGLPVDQAIVRIDQLELTTFSDGSTPRHEFEIATVWKGATEFHNTSYQVTIKKEEESRRYQDRLFADTTHRNFIFNYYPVVERIPDKYINEDELSYYDISMFISDKDNQNLTIRKSEKSRDNNNVTINGQIIELRYNRPAPEDKVFLEVTDGSIGVEFDLTVHVKAVNDRPEYNGSTNFTIMEDQNLVLDLSQHLYDEDDAIGTLQITGIDNAYNNYIEKNGLVMVCFYCDRFPNVITSDHVIVTVADPWGATCTIELDIIVVPVNDPPVIMSMPKIEPCEKTRLEMDLYKYLSDADNFTSDIRLSVNSSYCEANGSKLIFYYPEGVFKDYIQINVSDGWNWTYYNIEINVTPLNDPPTLLPIPALDVTAGVSRFENLWPYISDPEKSVEEFKINCDSQYVIVNGTNITIRFPTDTPAGKKSIRLNVTDGNATSDDITVTVNVKGGVDGGSLIKYADEIYILVPLALIAGVGTMLAYRRYKYGWYKIRRTFLVYQDGRMLAHYGDKADSDDEMLVSSMLTAVQQFIEEAMKKEHAGPIQEFQYKDMKIAVEKGRRLFLAVILKGYTTDNLRKQMKDLVNRIESKHDKTLKEWDGRMTKLPLIKEAEAELKKLSGKEPVKKEPDTGPRTGSPSG